LRHKRANGERVGTVPFGYFLAADGVRLEPKADEQTILSHIQALRASGRTMREIAAGLNATGFTTRRGTAWRFQYVAQAIRSDSDCRRLSPAA
jgi:hypothetical protein